MTNKLEITEIFAGHSIRIVGTHENPLFIAKDVCAALALENVSRALTRLEDDEKGVTQSNTLGGTQSLLFVTESGLFTLILRSDKPEAKVFRKWVTSEVLPAIRKTGSYAAAPMALPTHSEALRGWANALEANEAQAAQIEAQAATLAIAAPKVEFHDTVTASDSVCQLAVACQVAKLKFGRNILYRKLREMGVLIDGGHRHNLPKQDYIKRGIFTVETSKYNHPHTDEPIIKFTTHATQKGIAWLIKTFKGVTELAIKE
jgi:anti-repressor protein